MSKLLKWFIDSHVEIFNKFLNLIVKKKNFERDTTLELIGDFWGFLRHRELHPENTLSKKDFNSEKEYFLYMKNEFQEYRKTVLR